MFDNKEKFEDPACYKPNEDPHPLCKGAESPQMRAENDCFTCCLYENMDEPPFEK